MGRLFRIRIIEEKIESFKLENTYFELKFREIDLENFEGKSFIKDLLKKDEFRENETFAKYAKSLTELIGQNYVFLMKPNKESVLIKTIEDIEITKKGTKIYFEKIKELEEARIPKFLKLNEKTKNIYFNKVDSKSDLEIGQLLDALIEEKSLESFSEFYLTGDRQATASAKGYIEQSYMAHYFLFKNENYKQIKSIKIEGKLEDIELEYENNEKDYIQVKISEAPQNEEAFDTNRFIGGINGLEKTYNLVNQLKIPNKQLIYASNTIKQPILKLTNLLEAGHEVNLDYDWNKFSPTEKENIIEIIGEKENSFKEKLKIVRVSPEYLKSNPNKFLDEFNQLNNNLGTTNDKLDIYKELSRLFIENSVTREEKIDIKEIAYKFFKKKTGSEKFNEFYEEEMDDIDISSIDDFLGENDLEYKVKSRINEIYIIEHFYEMVDEYEQSNLKLKVNNSRGFIENYYLKFKEQNILGNLDYLEKEEKNIVYKYFLYKIIKGRTALDNIKKEFNLEGI